MGDEKDSSGELRIEQLVRHAMPPDASPELIEETKNEIRTAVGYPNGGDVGTFDVNQIARAGDALTRGIRRALSSR